MLCKFSHDTILVVAADITFNGILSENLELQYSTSDYPEQGTDSITLGR